MDFPLEDPDELTTSGDGTFDTRSLAEAVEEYSLPYDTPPHDGTYFSHHLDALARYYRAVSDGRVNIEYTVLPEDPGSAYTMPERALIYGNGRTPEQIDKKWVALLRDAVAAAADDAVFSDYNSFLVFHAGLGHETGELNDVRSVFLDPEDLESVGEPVLADGGTFELPDAWIMPETVNVRGRAGLNGLLAKFFGFQLGLQGLSNTAVGVPGLGGWSLMDVGATRLGFVRIEDELEAGFGFVPPHPMAWSKIQLNWIQPLTVRRDTVVALVATDRALSASGTEDEAVAKAVKIPVSPTEYFLLENRQQRGRNGLPGGVPAPFGEDDPVWLDQSEIDFSHTLSTPEAGDRSELVGAGGGVWLGVPEYDAFVPGSGILIWHVDEEAMAAGLLIGGVNNDRRRPGIALEEADGFRHIGNVFFNLQQFTEGTQEDPFFVGQAATGDQGSSRFDSHSEPASLTNTGLDSGVEIEVLSELGDTMRVRITFARTHAGWPQPVAGARRLRAIPSGDGDADRLAVEDESGVRVLAGDGRQLWNQPGAALLAAAAGGELFSSSDGSIQAWTAVADDGEVGRLWSVEQPGPIAAALYSAQLQLWPGVAALVVAGSEGVTGLDATSGEMLQQWPQAAAALNAADMDGDGFSELIAVSSGGGQGWMVTTSDPVSLWDDPAGRLQPISGDLDGDGRDEVVSLSRTGVIEVISTGSDADVDIRQLSQQLIPLTDATVTGASLADVDGDGFLEVVAASGRSIHVIRVSGGLIQPGFPTAAPMHHEAGDFIQIPVTADLDGDGRQEILASGPTGVHGFDDDGALLSGFPLLADTPALSAPVVANLDGSGELEVAVLTQQHLHVWDPWRLAAAYRGHDVGWGQDGFDASGTYSHRRGEQSPLPTPAAHLLPTSRAYCYPNPVGAEGVGHLRFFLSAAAAVELEVFDAIGERVDRLSFDSASFTVPGENEIAWSTADYASGLYICRMEVRTASGEQEHVLVNMAVSR